MPKSGLLKRDGIDFIKSCRWAYLGLITVCIIGLFFGGAKSNVFLLVVNIICVFSRACNQNLCGKIIK